MDNLYQSDNICKISSETAQESIKQRIMIYGLINYVHISLDIAAQFLDISEASLTAVYEGKALLARDKFLKIMKLIAIYSKPLPPEMLVA
ncbi:hypothetical protein [Legionella geestiana]|nr:hypothetical protein [Legionella geestiana]QBS12149.1 hypothetical protein E4T54_05000 [Legionella geestiana]QDQ40137.1 hypothetical protein E3226_006840 [Legionella geestiana]